MSKNIFLVIFAILFGVLAFILFGTHPVQNKDLEEAINMDAQDVVGKKWDQPPAMAIDTNKSYTAVMETSKGTMKIELFASEDPQTVNNFVFLAKEHFYDGVVFHRIIKDFMIQGGDPTGTGTGGPGYKFADEEVTRDYLRGTIAMANSGPDTNGSQFFIVHQDNHTLPKDYSIFGKIDENDAESLKTLDAIAETPVTQSVSGEQSQPSETVDIESVTIEEK